jgi:hypothetical protein
LGTRSPDLVQGVALASRIAAVLLAYPRKILEVKVVILIGEGDVPVRTVAALG